MEVHAHSHTERKKWKHYFWEFLMLFLAVFCGFMAENQREHFIEHQREKQFIRSLIKDVEADVIKLKDIIVARDEREERLDSLSFLINSDSAEKYTRDIYYLAITIPRVTHYQFTQSDGTMQQLKAGGLRLLRKRNAVDSIVKYDRNVKSMIRLDDQEQDILNIHRQMAPQLFLGTALSKFSDEDNLPKRVDYSPPLMPGYKNSLNEFNYRIVSIRNVNKGYRREARKLLGEALNLIETLKAEYGY